MKPNDRALGPDERKFVSLAIDGVDSAGSFSGYASLFGKVDLGRDVVERGAFARSLERRGAAGIRMLFQHDPNEPIGVWTEICEDRRGLFVRGRLALEASRAREVHALMRGKALDGLSIGFRAARARTDPRTGIRHIHEADLWEISVVTFPMLPQARVELVKGAATPRTAGRRAAAILVGKDIHFHSHGRLAATIRRAARLFRERNRRK